MKQNLLIYIVIGIIIVGGGIILFITKKESNDNTLSSKNQNYNYFQNTDQTQANEQKEKDVIATQTIIMKADNFEPLNITIKKNTKVIFKNEDNVARWPASNLHPTHGIYPEFDPQEPVIAGDEWSFVFDKVGNWKYHDHLIPSIRGEIKV